MEIGETLMILTLSTKTKFNDCILNFFVSKKSFSKGAKIAEEEEKAPEPDMVVAEEGNIFYKSKEINSD